MAIPGYIYILQNESLAENRLKIGRTINPPQQRASDLSGATGVPTPYTVVWFSYTEDCVLAESIVHRALAAFRTNPRREFFDLDLKQAIRAGEKAAKEAGRPLLRRRRACPHDPNQELASRNRSIVAWFFHSVCRPIARFPVEIIIAICTAAAVSGVFVIQLCMALLGGLLSGVITEATGRRRRRRWW